MAHPIFDGNVGRTVIYDHELTELTGELVENTSGYSESQRIYEVIRCIGGIPLFVEDHLTRLKKSISAAMPNRDVDMDIIMSDISAMILSDGIVDGNIKVVITNDASFVFPNISYYPPESSYINGVYAGILNWKRERPNVKMISDEYKAAVADKLSSQGMIGSYFETLLANMDGWITEGSRSNVFFVSGSEILTAPDNLILKGITRKYVIEAIRSAGYGIRFECIKAEDIGSKVKSAFLSGTSTESESIDLEIPDPILWNAEQPFLYTIEISTVDEVIVQKYGLRKIYIEGPVVKLNGTAIKFNLVPK